MGTLFLTDNQLKKRVLMKSSFAQEISDVSQQFPDAVVLSGIDDRIQRCQVDIKCVPAYKPLIHLDVPDTAEKSGGVTGFKRLLYLAFLDPSAFVQNRYIQDFTAAEGIGNTVLFPVFGMM